MARGTQFLQLVVMLRNELSRSTNVAVGVDDLPRLKYQINKAYETRAEYAWPHLRTEFAKIPLQAGERFYDFPNTIDFDSLEEVKAWWNDRPLTIERGITLADFAAYDSTAGERSSPVQKWDIRWTGTEEQLDVWPIPADNGQAIQFIGAHKTGRLVNDIDRCLIDDYLVVLDAAARTSKDPDDRQMFLAEAGARFAQLTAKAATNLPAIRLGLDRRQDTVPSHVIVRVR